MDKSFMIVAGFSFERVEESKFGKPYLLVIDLKNEEQQAQYVVSPEGIVERVSTFTDPGRRGKLQQVIETNTTEILEEFDA